MLEGLILLVALVALIMLGVPVALALVVVSLAGLLWVVDTSLLVLAQQAAAGADSFALLAIPLFLLAGALMNAGGITRRLITFANVLVGRLPGGLGMVNVGVSIFFSGISGSAVADTSAVGKAMIPGMSENGYPRSFAAAVTASSSVLGPIIPPSIPVVIYALSAGVPIGPLFLAGVMPGLFFGALLLLLTIGISWRRRYPRLEGVSLRSAARATVDALAALMMPGIIVVGVASGVFTATESAAIAVLYAFILAVFVYRELHWRALPRHFADTAISSAAILFIVAVATLFGWVLVRTGMPQQLPDLLGAGERNPLLVLLLINLLLLVFGTFLEGNAAIVVLTPLLLPIATSLGVDPIQFGIIIVFNLMIGLVTPPVGMCLFVAADIANLSVMRVARSVVPFLLGALLTLLVITYWPPLTLWLPGSL